jgi:hypothetical protein
MVVMIFGSMAVVVHCVEQYYFHRQVGETVTMEDDEDSKKEEDWEGVKSQIKVHHCWGIFFSIVALIQTPTVLTLGLPTVLYLLSSAGCYAIFVQCLHYSSACKQQDKIISVTRSSAGFISTYIMIAVTWVAMPVIENFMTFCILWGLYSIVLTFLSCLALRLQMLHVTEWSYTERIFLPMESLIFFCSHTGIGLGWILSDLIIIMDWQEQIVPIIVRLALSLLFVCGNVSCFSEEWASRKPSGQ